MSTGSFPVVICDGCKYQNHPGTNAGCIGCERTPEPAVAEPLDPRAFNPDKTLAVVLAPGGMLHYSLQCWLMDIGVAAIEWQEKFYRNYEDAYNGMILDHALHSRNAWAEQFIFADCDLRPNLRQTNAFLDLLDGDVRCVEYETSVGPLVSWNYQTAFHTGIWWIKRETLLSLKRPWFKFRKSADGCRTLGCICEDLRKKILDAGYTIRHGGHAGHTPRPSKCYPIGESQRDLL